MATTLVHRVLIVAGGIAATFAVWQVATTYVAYTSDAYVRSDLIGVAAQVTGQIVEITVRDNQPVRVGDQLVRLDPVPFELVVAEHQAEIDEAAARVRADQDAVTAARNAVTEAAAALTLATETQTRVANLIRTGDAPAQRLDEAKEVQQCGNAALAAAQAAQARSEALLSQHQAAQAQAEAAMATARWRLARTQLVAPADGTINNLTVRVGDMAQADRPLIGIVASDAWRVIANYKQDYLRALSVGGAAWVWLDSQPWHLHRARIEGITRGIDRGGIGNRLLPHVAPTTDWIRLQHRFPVTLTLLDMPLFMGADARVPRRASGRLRLQPVLWALHRVAAGRQRDDAADARRRREAVRGLRRRHRAGVRRG